MGKIKESITLIEWMKYLGFREFNDNDRLNYPHALSFNDGQLPLIKESNGQVIILDRSGLYARLGSHVITINYFK